VSVSVDGSLFSIEFAPKGAAVVEGEIGHEGKVVAVRWEGGRTLFEGGFPYRPDETGHFLLLYLDERGEVFGANGGPLPPGDFTAG
jgi:hypothetical protein